MVSDNVAHKLDFFALEFQFFEVQLDIFCTQRSMTDIRTVVSVSASSNVFSSPSIVHSAVTEKTSTVLWR